MQAPLFHVTQVSDASAMVFAKLLQLLLFFSGCEQEDDRGFKLIEEDYRRGIMRSQHPPHCDGGQQRGLRPRCALAYWRALAYPHRSSVALCSLPSCQHSLKTKRNAINSRFTGECGFKTTSKAGLEPGFKSAL